MSDQSPPASDAAPGTTASSRLSLPVPSLPFGIDSKRVLWYGGLAALATVGVIEWPVAAVVGVGSYVAERLAREDAQHSAPQHS
jgi:type IV secretory pathway TrbD component